MFFKNTNSANYKNTTIASFRNTAPLVRGIQEAKKIFIAVLNVPFSFNTLASIKSNTWKSRKINYNI